MALYPLKFHARFFHKIWGGHTIAKWYDNVPADYENVGESWVLSDIDRYPTEVSNGPHSGDILQDLIEVYMDELVGEKIYDVFGTQFPLLLKFIDATDDLSIQVHPGDDYAVEHEHSLGKTEMWYVLPAEGESSIFLGWNQEMNASLVQSAIADGSFARYLHHYVVKPGDVAFIPPGTVHAMQRGTIVAEIQENSDLTYRIYDYNRVGNDGCTRPLKISQALEVMDYSPAAEAKVTHPVPNEDGVVNLKKCDHFTTNLLCPAQVIQRDYAPLDSFVVYMCTQGSALITALDCDLEDNRQVAIRQGEAVLIPASLNDIEIEPLGTDCNLLEVYMEL